MSKKPKLSTIETGEPAKVAPTVAPGRLLSREEVLAIVNVSYPTLWWWVREKHFPAPKVLGLKGKRGRIGWIESEVQAWILALPRRFPKGTKLPTEVA
jgi:predicted DNA-binding transcriptional regulator AlpA